MRPHAAAMKALLDQPQMQIVPGCGDDAQMREAVAACEGKPSVSVTSPAGKHYMPCDAGLAAAGIKFAIYPQEILAATVLAVRAALAGLKGGPRAPMASVPDLAIAVRTAEYLAMDASQGGTRAA